MSLTSVARTGAVRTGPFSYMAATVERSLYRNGKVLLHRDCHGNDTGITGLDLEERQMPVHDARCRAESQRRTLHTNGFELLERPVSTPDIDFLNHDQVVRRYYPHCEDIAARRHPPAGRPPHADNLRRIACAPCPERTFTNDLPE